MQASCWFCEWYKTSLKNLLLMIAKHLLTSCFVPAIIKSIHALCKGKVIKVQSLNKFFLLLQKLSFWHKISLILIATLPLFDTRYIFSSNPVLELTMWRGFAPSDNLHPPFDVLFRDFLSKCSLHMLGPLEPNFFGSSISKLLAHIVLFASIVGNLKEGPSIRSLHTWHLLLGPIIDSAK